MNFVEMLIYTLEPIFDGHIAETTTSKLNDYLDFTSNLTEDSQHKLTSAINMTARYIIETSKTNDYDYSIDIRNIFMPNTDEFLTINSNVDTLKLVEWAYYGCDEIKIINEYKINVNVTKGVFLRNLFKFIINDEDFDKILNYYKLVKHYDVVTSGDIINSDSITYIRKYSTYLREFYIRNADIDPDLLNKYNLRIKFNRMVVYRSYKKDTETLFPLYLNTYDTRDNALYAINEYYTCVKFLTERRYALSTPEDKLKASSGKGRKHYKEQFSLWDRYLRIYDLYKGYENKNQPINLPQIDAIGKTIVKEFGMFKAYKITDLRREIIKGYNEALRLIEQSKTGALS